MRLFKPISRHSFGSHLCHSFISWPSHQCRTFSMCHRCRSFGSSLPLFLTFLLRLDIGLSPSYPPLLDSRYRRCLAIPLERCVSFLPPIVDFLFSHRLSCPLSLFFNSLSLSRGRIHRLIRFPSSVSAPTKSFSVGLEACEALERPSKRGAVGLLQKFFSVERRSQLHIICVLYVVD